MDKYKSDIEIVKAISDGDDELYDQLYLEFRYMLYGLCLKYFKSPQEAQDHTILLYELLHKRMKGKDIANIKSWIYTVAKNSCLEKLRKQNNQKEKLIDAQNVYYDQLLHQDSIDKESMLTKLSSCVEELKEHQQACIKAFYLEEKNYEQIAAQMKMEWKKVRSNIQNGRRNLKICMDK